MVDGWYRTGDVGWLEPEGWVHLTDRSKEMIKVNGFQVAPAELEAVLHGHPAVLDCAVFGVPDERAGELPVAAVQFDPAVPLRDGELQGSGGRFPGHVQTPPRRGDRRHRPRLPSGKVLRRVLRDEWIAGPTPLPGSRPDGRPPLARAGGPAPIGRPGGRSTRTTCRRRDRGPRAHGEARRRRVRIGLAGTAGRGDGGRPVTSGVEVALIAEELGRGLADVPFVGPILAGELRRVTGAP